METMKMEKRMVSQIDLAKALRLTDRRIRQLVDERILPPALSDGHEFELCQHRYWLFASGTELEWDAEYSAAERLAVGAKVALDLAMGPRASLADVSAAVAAITASTSSMAFLTGAKSKTDTERALFWGIWDREEEQALRALMARAIELGATHFTVDGGETVAADSLMRPTRGSKAAKGCKGRQPGRSPAATVGRGHPRKARKGAR
jgi:hypothetical protein